MVTVGPGLSAPGFKVTIHVSECVAGVDEDVKEIAVAAFRASILSEHTLKSGTGWREMGGFV